MNYNFFIIGGDERMFYLAKNLANDGNKVKVLGFEKIGYEVLLNNNIKLAHSINDVDKNEILIGGVPITKDNVTFYTPYSDKKIFLKDINNSTIIAGNIPKNLKGTDILKDESLAILNAIPTAEGTIAKIIQKTESTIMDANILVIGFGRIGKILCNRLKTLGAHVYCTARKSKDFAWMKAYGYNGIIYSELDKNLCKMDIIINTVPAIILDKKKLVLLRENVLVLDLASNPGGVETDVAKKLKIKYEQYLGIPGKIAPDKSSEFIKEFLYKKMEEKK